MSPAEDGGGQNARDTGGPGILPETKSDQRRSRRHANSPHFPRTGQDVGGFSWNAAGTSSVWVKLPQLAPGEKLLVWWGKAGQSPPPAAPAWSAFQAVWHLDELLGFAKDSSPKGNPAAATAITAAAVGVMPGAAGLNGTTATVAIDNTVALNPSFSSVEAWVKTSNRTGILSVFNKDNSGPGFVLWSGRHETLPGGMERAKVRVTEPVLATAPHLFARLRLIGVK